MDSIAVVVLDTLRWDAFDEYFDWIPGIKFTNAYSTSHWTIPAHASLYTGMYPSEVGVHANSLSLESDSTLPQLLKQKGYNTRLVSANPHIYMWDGWRQGFDEAISPTNLDPNKQKVLDWDEFYAECESSGLQKYSSALQRCLTSDCATVPSIIAGLKTTDHPALSRLAKAMGSDKVSKKGIEVVSSRIDSMNFGDSEFALVNLLDAHTPYAPPENFASVDTPVDVLTGEGFSETEEDPEVIVQAYNDSAKYLSAEYKKLFEQLQSEFDVVITLSDHGEMLGEHGRWNHGYGLYKELTHVPIAISGKNIENKIDDSVVNLIDIHKTILEIANLDADSRGQNLLDSPMSKNCLFEYHGFLDWHRKQFDRMEVPEEVFDKYNTNLRGFVTKDNEYAYQIHTEPQDGVVLKSDIDDQVAKDKLEELIEKLDVKTRTREEDYEDVSNSVRKQLEDLGYA
ncbi:sulfatase-like hydrolase/transferase [Haloarcula sp. H-GB5]